MTVFLSACTQSHIVHDLHQQTHVKMLFSQHTHIRTTSSACTHMSLTLMWSDQTELPANRPSDRTVNVGPHYLTWQHWFPSHTNTHWEDSEIWALDLTWQQRLLLSLTPDPFLPDVPSSFAPPCPSLSRRTNVIEESLFGQAVSHFLHVRKTHAHIHVHVLWSHTHTFIQFLSSAQV